MAHRFKVGQLVEYKPIGANVGLYKVLRHLPEEFPATDRMYRIKSDQRALSGPCTNAHLVRPSCQRRRTTRSSLCDAPAGTTDVQRFFRRVLRFLTATVLFTVLAFRRAAERFCLRGSIGFETVSAAARLIRGAAAPNLWPPLESADAALSTTTSAPALAAAPRAAPATDLVASTASASLLLFAIAKVSLWRRANGTCPEEFQSLEAGSVA
jgi:hypothetical protein